MSAYEIQYWKGKGKRPFRAHLVCPGNHEILAPSQGYASSQGRAKTWSRLAAALKCKIVKLKAAPKKSDGEAELQDIFQDR